MKASKILLIGFALISIPAAASTTALACKCAPQTVDIRYAGSRYIAIVKVEAVGRDFKPDRTPVDFLRGSQSLVAVRKVFKGDLQVAENLVFRNTPTSMCGWSFAEKDVGKEFLLFFDSVSEPGTAGSKPEIWRSSSCSRSGPVERRVGDLSYINNIDTARGRSRISGVVFRSAGSTLEPIANQKISIVGNGKEREIITNDSGLYEIYDLPPARYEIKVEAIPGHQIQSASLGRTFELKAGTQHEADIYFLSLSNAMNLSRSGMSRKINGCLLGGRALGLSENL